MITFLDGPAEDVTLVLRRAPKILRVVQNAAGEWDACDQISDVPRADEKGFVYVCIGEPTLCFIDPGGQRMFGYYVLYSEQPADEVLRDNGRWRAWALEHRADLMARYKEPPAGCEIQPCSACGKPTGKLVFLDRARPYLCYHCQRAEEKDR